MARQIPEIEKILNAKSAVKIKIDLDASSFQKEVSGAAAAAEAAIKKRSIDFNLGLNPDSERKLREHLKSLNVSPEIIRKMVDGLSGMDVQIDRITGSWKTLAGEEQRALNLTIKGSDAIGRNITLTERYEAAAQEVAASVVSVTNNFEKQRQIAEAAAKAAERDAAQRIEYLRKQQTALNELQAVYKGEASVKPVFGAENLRALDDAYQSIQDRLTSLKSAQGALSSEERSNVAADVAALKLKIQTYQNLEYAAVQLRTKTVSQVKYEQGIKLGDFESELKRAGLLTREFQDKIATVREELNKAFDRNSLTNFLNGFDELKTEFNGFQSQIKSVDALYKELMKVENAIAGIEVQLTKIDSDAGARELAGKKEELAVQRQIKERIESQISAYESVVSYSNQAKVLSEQRLVNEAKVAAAASRVGDAVADQTAAMSEQIERQLSAINKITGNARVEDSASSEVAKIREQLTAFADEYSRLQDQLRRPLNKEELNGFESELKEVDESFKEVYAKASAFTKFLTADNSFETFTKRAEAAKKSLEAYGEANTALFGDAKLAAEYKRLTTVDIPDPSKLAAWRAEVSKFKSEVAAAGKNTLSFGDAMRKTFSAFTQWFSVAEIITRIQRSFTDMITTVRDVNSAMTELRKVTDETAKSYDAFLVRSASNAVKLGTTLTDIIKATSGFARLGYSMEDAERLAEVASLYARVGDDARGIEGATDSIISVMKAFSIEADEALGIVDKFNKVGNEFAISSGDIGEGLRRSASALAAAGNSIDQSIAMITAMNEVVQDVGEAGNAIKVVSMRIRGASTDLEAAGESTDGMVKSVSKLRDAIKELTNVDGSGGFDIMLDDTKFKNTYEILDGISKVWKDISDIDQANLLEIIAGKQRGNTVMALLNNWETAENTLAASLNSTDSAMQEHAKWLDSIEAKYTQFQASMQAFSVTFLDDGLIKGVLDFGVSFMDVMTRLTDAFGSFPVLLSAGTTAFGLLNKEFNIFEALVEAVNGQKVIPFEVEAIEKYNAAISSTNIVQTGFVESLTEGREHLAGYFATLDGGKGTWEGYKEYLEKIGAANKVVGISAKIAAVGQVALNAAMNALIGMGVGIALQAITAGLDRFINRAKYAAEAAKELADSTKETTDRRRDEAETIERLIEEYKELAENGVQADERERAAEIQKTIVSLIGDEGSKVSLLNGEYDEQLKILQKIGEEKRRQAVLDAKLAANAAVDAAKNPQQAKFSGKATPEIISAFNNLGLDKQINQLGRTLYDNGIRIGFDNLNNFVLNLSGSADECVDRIKAMIDALGGLDTTTPENNKLLSFLREQLEIYEGLKRAAKEAAKAQLEAAVASANDIVKTTRSVSDSAKSYNEYKNALFQTALGLGTTSAALKDGTLSIEDINAAVDNLMATKFPDFFQQINDEASKTDFSNAITGANAYADALEGFKDVSDAVAGYSSGINNLASLQEILGNSFTTTAEKALELAEAYPKILEGAKTTADGQIRFNKDVIESIISGEKEALEVKVNAKIQELESEKAVWEARKAFAEAQLGIAEGIAKGEYETETARDRAIAAARQILIDRLIELGFSEADAAKEAYGQMSDAAGGYDFDVAEVANSIFSNLKGALVMAANAAKKNYGAMAQSAFDFLRQAVQATNAAYTLDSAASAELVEDSRPVNMKSAPRAVPTPNKIDVGGGGINGDGFSAKSSGVGGSGGKGNALGKGALELAEWTETLREEISGYTQAIAQIDGQIAVLEALKTLPFKELADGGAGSGGGGTSESGASDGAALKEAEEYIAVINKLYKAEERLKEIHESKARLDIRIDMAKTEEERLGYMEKLLLLYKDEQAALALINNIRREQIKTNVEDLRENGFIVEYDADANKFLIDNMERINELKGDDEEATAELRKAYEDLISTTIELNDANKENSQSWLELQQDIAEQENAVYRYWLEREKRKITILDKDRINDNGMEIVDSWIDILARIESEIKKYADLGYDYSSDKIQSLTNDIWEAEEEIQSALKAILDASHEAADSIENVYAAFKAAAKEFGQEGWITVDTFQEIARLGVEYLAYLIDENGQLVINEEAVYKVIEAKTQQVAVETALNYIAALRLARQKGDAAELQRLLFATEKTTKSTWDLVYAELALLNLESDQYNAALTRINTLRSLADTSIASIGKVAGAAADELERQRKELEETLKLHKKMLEDQKDYLDKLLDYVMDMIKWEIGQQIKALREQVTLYNKIVDAQKESLRLAKEKDNYDRNVANRVKSIADLQSRINQLSLDDSREARAEKKKLEEELAKQQESLTDYQNDYAYDAQIETLDKMADAFAKEKQKEIDILENSISSQQKLYEMAIDRIENRWDTLYRDLSVWVYEAANITQDELNRAWDAASAAVQRYGSYLEAVIATQRELAAVTAELESASSRSVAVGGGGNAASAAGSSESSGNVVGNVGNYGASSSGGGTPAPAKDRYELDGYLRAMQINSASYSNSAPDVQKKQAAANEQYAAAVSSIIGRPVIKGSDGVWYLDRVGGQLLYSAYNSGGAASLFKYHSGGVVGGAPDGKDDEILALLRKNELVLTEPQKEAAYSYIDFGAYMADKLGAGVNFLPDANAFGGAVAEAESILRRNVGGLESSGAIILNMDVVVNGGPGCDEAREIGRGLGDGALERLREGFARRGVVSAAGTALRG